MKENENSKYQPVNSALDENQPELGVLVFPVGLQVLTHGNRLFDEVPKVLRNGWAKSYSQTKRHRRKRKERKKKT